MTNRNDDGLTPELRASLERGLRDSAEGRTVGLGDFTQFADDEE